MVDKDAEVKARGTIEGTEMRKYWHNSTFIVLFPFRMLTIGVDARGWQVQIGTFVQVSAITCFLGGMALSSCRTIIMSEQPRRLELYLP